MTGRIELLTHPLGSGKTIQLLWDATNDRAAQSIVCAQSYAHLKETIEDKLHNGFVPDVNNKQTTTLVNKHAKILPYKNYQKLQSLQYSCRKALSSKAFKKRVVKLGSWGYSSSQIHEMIGCTDRSCEYLHQTKSAIGRLILTVNDYIINRENIMEQREYIYIDEIDGLFERVKGVEQEIRDDLNKYSEDDPEEPEWLVIKKEQHAFWESQREEIIKGKSEPELLPYSEELQKLTTLIGIDKFKLGKIEQREDGKWTPTIITPSIFPIFFEWVKKGGNLAIASADLRKGKRYRDKLEDLMLKSGLNPDDIIENRRGPIFEPKTIAIGMPNYPPFETTYSKTALENYANNIATHKMLGILTAPILRFQDKIDKAYTEGKKVVLISFPVVVEALEGRREFPRSLWEMHIFSNKVKGRTLSNKEYGLVIVYGDFFTDEDNKEYKDLFYGEKYTEEQKANGWVARGCEYVLGEMEQYLARGRGEVETIHIGNFLTAKDEYLAKLKKDILAKDGFVLEPIFI